MKKLLILPLLLLPFACTSESSEEPAKPEESTTPAVPAVPVASAITGMHTVKCGCVVDGVNKCGNYVEIEGEFIEIAGDVGLGKMEWCGQGEKNAEVEGALVGGKFVATSVALAE